MLWILVIVLGAPIYRCGGVSSCMGRRGASRWQHLGCHVNTVTQWEGSVRWREVVAPPCATLTLLSPHRASGGAVRNLGIKGAACGYLGEFIPERDQAGTHPGDLFVRHPVGPLQTICYRLCTSLSQGLIIWTQHLYSIALSGCARIHICI